MSRVEPPADANSAPAPAEASAPRRRGFLRTTARWIKRIAITLAVVLLLARATLGLWLPKVANSAVSSMDLHVSWTDFDLSILGLSLDLVGVRLVPLPAEGEAVEDLDAYLAAARPLARIDDLGVDADVSALFTGDLKVHRVELGGVEAWLDRDEDGTWNFERHFARKDSEGAEEEAADSPPETPEDNEADDAQPEPAEEAPDPAALDFTVPVEIATIDLHGIRLHLDDRAAQPALATTLDLGAQIRDVGHDVRPIQARITGAADHVLDALLIEATAELGVATVDVDFDAAITGVGLQALAPYLALAGVEPSASKLNLRTGAHMKLKPLAPISGSGAEGESGADDRVVDLGGTIELRSLVLDADGVVAAELQPAVITVARARTTAYEIESVILEGLTARATKLPNGTLRVAGLDLVGAPPAEAEPEEEKEATDEDADGAASAAPSFRVAHVELGDVDLEFRDESFDEPVTLNAAITAAIDSIVMDPAEPGAPLTLDLQASLENAGAVQIKGSVVPTGEEISADLTLGGSELTLAAVRPYLENAGLASTLTAGELGGAIRFSMIPGAEATDDEEASPTRIQASISELRLGDGATTHAALGAVTVTNLVLGPDGSTALEALVVEGGTIPITLYPGGAFRGLGLETLGLETLGLGPDAAGPAEGPANGRVLGVANASLTLSDLFLDDANQRAKLVGSLGLTRIADAVTLDATVSKQPGTRATSAELSLAGENVTLEGLRDVLLAQGIEPDFENGSLRLSAEALLREGEGDEPTLEIEARVFDVALANRGADVLGIQEIQLDGFRSGPSGLVIDEIRVAEPKARVARNEEGVLLAAGLRIGVRPESVDVIDEEDAAPENASIAAAAPAGAEDAPEETQESGSDPQTLLIERFQLSGLEVEWSDRFVTPGVDTSLTADVEATSIDLSGAADAAPIRVRVTSTLAGAMEALSLEANVALQGERQRVDATFEINGLRAGPLAAYLPEGLEVTLEDGRMRAQLNASVDPVAEGGQAIRASVNDFDYRDGAEGETLLAFQALELDVPRLDGGSAERGAVYDVESLTLSGFAFEAEKVAADRTEVLGLALISAPAPTPGEPPLESPTETGDDAADGAETLSPEKASERAPAAPSGPPAVAPTIRLGKLDLGIDRLRYVDRTRPNAIPLDLNLALVTPGPQVLCQPDPEDLPALEFSAVGALSPLVGGIELSASLEPYAADPGAGFRVLIDQITGAKLAEISPELAAQLDPSGYVDGSFEINGDARLSFARRGPLDFNLARGFGATLNVDRFALKPTPDAEATGFDRLDVDVKRVDPATGDVRISSIDLGGLYARVEQSTEGMTVAGLFLPAPPPAEPVTGEAQAEGGSPSGELLEPVAPEAPLDLAASPEIAPEFAVDRLTVSGLDFEFLDTTFEPALRLPITDLQLEVQRFTTRTLVERRPFSFRAVVDAGEVELPERTGVDNLLFGVLNSAASAVTLSNETYETERRRVWDLLETSGRLSLGPEPRGRVQFSLLGLELPAFRGAALGSGVDIGDGLLDNRTKVRFREDGGIGIDSKTTTTYLSLSEPPGGPISEYLKLPAPLDTVLFLLRNEAGEQKLPVRLDVPPDGVGGGQIAGLVANTLGGLITEAVSSAPLRVLGPLGSVAGALGLTSEPLTADTVTLEFSDGAATMAAASIVPNSEPSTTAVKAPADPIEAVAIALRGNPDLRVVVQAELGEGDIEVARRLANPPREKIDALIARGRARKASLERERATLAAKAKARIFAGTARGASGDPADEEGEDLVARLQALDSERADVERSLDELFGYIRPGAERRADMRTRNAALALAEERLDRVRRDLLRRVGGAVATRIDVRRARFRKGTEKNPIPPLGLVTITPK